MTTLVRPVDVSTVRRLIQRLASVARRLYTDSDTATAVVGGGVLWAGLGWLGIRE